jgi:type II secretory pathway component PulJ
MELLVAMGILAVVGGATTVATFQVLSIQGEWTDQVRQATELRHAGAAFARDALNPASTTLADLASATTTVGLQWEDVNGTTTVATYSLTGSPPLKQLVRTLSVNGSQVGQTEVARNVVSATFSRSGKVVTFDLTVKVGDSAATTRSLVTYLRNLN